MSDGRRWLELRVRSPSAGSREPLLVEGLLALGGRASEERDGWYVTHLPAPDDLEAFRSLADSTLRAVAGVDSLELQTEWRPHEEWSETWKRGLGARAITERILIRPSWVAQPDGAWDVVVVLDPGMAFGTAEHGTTRGCLRLLERAVSAGDHVLDVGSGSGILAVVAAKLGASGVVAVEADALAWEALRENLDRNGVADRVRCVEAATDAAGLAELGPASGVVANIESGTLLRLMPGFAAALEPGGWLILSGILEEEWPGVLDAAETAGFGLRELDADGEWRSGLLERVQP